MHRDVNDVELERITGVRTMSSLACVQLSSCMEKSIREAIMECKTENKKYEYVVHSFMSV